MEVVFESKFYNTIYSDDGDAVMDMISAYRSDPLKLDFLLNGLERSGGRTLGPSTNFAALHGKLKAFRALLTAGASLTSVDDGGRSVLFCAVENGHLSVIDEIIVSAATPTLLPMLFMVDKRGLTLLHLAVKSEAVWGKIMSILGDQASRPSDIDDRLNIQATSNGYTPLIVACNAGRGGVTRDILQIVKSPNVSDSKGQSPLIHACREGHFDVVKVLLSSPSVNVDLQDKYGDTALHWAVEMENDDIVKLVLKHGASRSIKNNKDAVALDSSREELIMKEIESEDVSGSQHPRDVGDLKEGGIVMPTLMQTPSEEIRDRESGQELSESKEGVQVSEGKGEGKHEEEKKQTEGNSASTDGPYLLHTEKPQTPSTPFAREIGFPVSLGPESPRLPSVDALGEHAPLHVPIGPPLSPGADDVDTEGGIITSQIREGKRRLAALEKECISPSTVVPADDLLSNVDALQDVSQTRALSHAKKIYRCPEILDIITKFKSCGGKVVFAPTQGEMEAGERFHISVRKSDRLYPVCHEGINRSQVLYVVLSGIMKSLGGDLNNVLPPHGAEGGFDPYQGYSHLTEDNFFEYCHGMVLDDVENEGEWLHRCFRHSFGTVKCKRFGAEFGRSLELNPTTFDHSQWRRLETDRRRMRAHMDETFFYHGGADSSSSSPASEGKGGEDSRHIYFCFMRAAHICMARLTEVYKARGESMRNVYIVALPYGDDISSAGSKSDIEAALAEGRLYVTRHDLSVEKHIESMGSFTDKTGNFTRGVWGDPRHYNAPSSTF